MAEEQYRDSGLAKPGSVRYMYAPALHRGLRIPWSIRGFISLFGIAAILIASIFGLRAYNDMVNAPSRYAQSVQEAIQNGPGLELPLLNSYVSSDNAAIRDSFKSMGYQIIDVDALYADEDELDENSLDLVKVPSNLEYSLATDLFKNSLRRTPILEAATYLAGSWRFTSYRAEGIDLKVKYADLSSPSIEDAINAAILEQGWSDSTFGESGVDQSGNTFQNGTIQVNDMNFHWSVSACPLDEVYNVSGLPESSYYVGVRLVQ